MPRPSLAKAFINAASSNSPTTRGCTACCTNHCSRRGRIGDALPWISIAAPFRFCGNSPLRVAATRSAAKKLVAVLPSAWL